MGTLNIEIDDSKIALLREKATAFGLSLDQLVIASVEDLIAHPDPDFEEAMRRVISKNKELYKRLS